MTFPTSPGSKAVRRPANRVKICTIPLFDQSISCAPKMIEAGTAYSIIKIPNPTIMHILKPFRRRGKHTPLSQSKQDPSTFSLDLWFRRPGVVEERSRFQMGRRG